MRTSSRLGELVGTALLAGAISFGTPALRAQSRVMPPNAAGGVGQSPGKEAVSPFVGSWTYRSFVSDPNLSTPTDKLLFGIGTMTLSVPAPDHLTGTLGGDDWRLDLKGGVAAGNPATIRFQGTGKIDGEEWVYDYLGFLVPVWPNGVSQRPAIVGTIVRTKAHSDGKGGIAPAGVVAQWIAVRQDETSGCGRGEVDAQRAMPIEACRPRRHPGQEKTPRPVSRRRPDGYVDCIRTRTRSNASERKRGRDAMPRRNRLELPRRSPRVLRLSTGPFRTNFQPRPSLHPLTYTSKRESGPPSWT